LKLKRFQNEQLKKIEFLISQIPRNRIYFRELIITPSKAAISGWGLDMNDITNYLGKLGEAKEMIKEVNLKHLKKEGFLINFKAEVNFKCNMF